MAFHRFGLRGWFHREISDPLTAMYAGIDDRLLRDADERDTPPPATTTHPPTSE